MADAKGIQIALSNPCFEFWYLLHFQYTTKFFKDYPAVKNALTTYLPDYEKAGDVYNQLAEHTAIAIQNAKRVEQYHREPHMAKVTCFSAVLNGKTKYRRIRQYLRIRADTHFFHTGYGWFPHYR